MKGENLRIRKPEARFEMPVEVLVSIPVRVFGVPIPVSPIAQTTE
jgi:hypothetical protein